MYDEPCVRTGSLGSFITLVEVQLCAALVEGSGVCCSTGGVRCVLL